MNRVQEIDWVKIDQLVRQMSAQLGAIAKVGVEFVETVKQLRESLQVSETSDTLTHVSEDHEGGQL